MTVAERGLVSNLATVVRVYRDLIVAGETKPDGTIESPAIRAEVALLDELLKRADEAVAAAGAEEGAAP